MENKFKFCLNTAFTFLEKSKFKVESLWYMRSHMYDVASFPGPAQLSIACSTGRAWEQGYMQCMIRGLLAWKYCSKPWLLLYWSWCWPFKRPITAGFQLSPRGFVCTCKRSQASTAGYPGMHNLIPEAQNDKLYVNSKTTTHLCHLSSHLLEKAFTHGQLQDVSLGWRQGFTQDPTNPVPLVSSIVVSCWSCMCA